MSGILIFLPRLIFHKISASKTNEEAISGVTEGLINLHETVNWKAKHFGFWHRMKVRITEYKKPDYFVDEMVDGTFKSMRHKHEFRQTENGTIMTDTFEFSSPLGILGKIVDHLILKNYMTNFLRNEILKNLRNLNDGKKYWTIKSSFFENLRRQVKMITKIIY